MTDVTITLLCEYCYGTGHLLKPNYDHTKSLEENRMVCLSCDGKGVVTANLEDLKREGKVHA